MITSAKSLRPSPSESGFNGSVPYSKTSAPSLRPSLSVSLSFHRVPTMRVSLASARPSLSESFPYTFTVPVLEPIANSCFPLPSRSPTARLSLKPTRFESEIWYPVAFRRFTCPSTAERIWLVASPPTFANRIAFTSPPRVLFQSRLPVALSTLSCPPVVPTAISSYPPTCSCPTSIAESDSPTSTERAGVPLMK